MVSAGESSSTLSNVNRKFTDIEASVPGSVILRPDASNAVSRYVQKRRWSAEYQSRSDSTNNTMPILAVEAINSFAWILIAAASECRPMFAGEALMCQMPEVTRPPKSGGLVIELQRAFSG